MEGAPRRSTEIRRETYGGGRGCAHDGPVRSATRRAVAGEVGLSVALLLACLVTLPFIGGVRDGDVAPDRLAVALIVAATGAVAFRRRRPLAAMLVAAGSTSAYLVLSYPYGPVMATVAVGVYSAASRLPLRTAGPAGGAVLLIMAAHIVTNDAALDGFAALVPVAAWVAIPFTIGVARRMVQEAVARERAETDRRLVDAERLRLAQEVHDVVGHGLAAIQMQADIALHMRQTNPGQAHVALEAISRASSDALAELRAALATSDDPDRGPTPGLARVADLRRRVEDAGVAVDLSVHGPPRPLPAAADLAAYRILQESLTNVVKHSPHPMATVSITYRPDGVVLTVANQDLPAGAPVEGFGIAGMRRRVSHLGGTLTAGPARTGVFEVRAEIPLRS